METNNINNIHHHHHHRNSNTCTSERRKIIIISNHHYPKTKHDCTIGKWISLVVVVVIVGCSVLSLSNNWYRIRIINQQLIILRPYNKPITSSSSHSVLSLSSNEKSINNNNDDDSNSVTTTTVTTTSTEDSSPQEEEEKASKQLSVLESYLRRKDVVEQGQRIPPPQHDKYHIHNINRIKDRIPQLNIASQLPTTIDGKTTIRIDNNNTNVLNITLYILHLVAIQEASIEISNQHRIPYQFSTTTTSDNDNDDNNDYYDLGFQFYLPTIGYRQCLHHTLPEYIQIKNFARQISYLGNPEPTLLCSNNNNNNCKHLQLFDFITTQQNSTTTTTTTVIDFSNSTLNKFIALSSEICKSTILKCGIDSTFLCGLIGLSVRTPVHVMEIEYNKWPKYIQQRYTFEIIPSNYNNNKTTGNKQEIVRKTTMEDLAIKSQVLQNHRILFNYHTIRTTHPIILQQYGLLDGIRYGNDTGFTVFISSINTLCDNTTRSNQPFRIGNAGDIFGSFLANYFIDQQQTIQSPSSRNNKLKYHVLCTSDFTKRTIGWNKNERGKYIPISTTTKKFIVPKPPRDYHLTFAFVGSTLGPTLKMPNLYQNTTTTTNNNSSTMLLYQKIILGLGFIDAKVSALRHTNIWSSDTLVSSNVRVLGVRGQLTRDILLEKFNINAEIVSDPGLYLYLVFQDYIDTVRTNISLSNNTKELCFIQHEVEIAWYEENMQQYKDRTIRAGGWGSEKDGNIYEFLSFLVSCNNVVSSSLHGVIFSHALSIPAMPIQVTNQVHGGDYKFYDYYYGINITTFPGRYNVHVRGMPSNEMEWLQILHTEYEQPLVPFNIITTNHPHHPVQRVQRLFNTIYGIQ